MFVCLFVLNALNLYAIIKVLYFGLSLNIVSWGGAIVCKTNFFIWSGKMGSIMKIIVVL